MRRIAALGLLLSCPLVAHALDAVVFEAREIRVAGVVVKDAVVKLDVLDESSTRLTVAAGNAVLPEPIGTLKSVSLVCDKPVIAEPRFSCDDGRLAGRGGPTGDINMRLSAGYDLPAGRADVSGAGLRIAGTTLGFRARADATGWQAEGETGTAEVANLLEFLQTWLELPADLTLDGKARIRGSARQRTSDPGPTIDATLDLTELNLTNEESTLVTDSVTATARVRAVLADTETHLEANVDGGMGQALLGPVLLDFGVNPLALETTAVMRGDDVVVQKLRVRQQDALELDGTATVNLAAGVPLVSADLEIGKLQFPAAYTSFMQITLAASLLGDMESEGTARGRVTIRDNAPVSAHLVPDNLTLYDRQDRLFLSKMSGDVYWAPENAPTSKLSWTEGGAYGLSGGYAEIEFRAQGDSFALTRPTKLPVLDGALAIEIFRFDNLGASDMELAFKGSVEPISMPRLATVFGWPQFQGTLAANIPGVTLKDNVLVFQGNVESEVFGGRIVGSNIRLQDPLGNFPQFFADVRARDLDLNLVTQTFEVGSITGRLDVDVLNLELFNWSPVSFDARLATPPGDKSRHRISAKAVTTLSNAGGGGGGVVKALQSGVLQFFDSYSYEKLGITCKLRNDVCEMSGVEPTAGGYYIVKGSGLPRIDIVGNAGRVRWSQLLSSITTTNYGGASTE